MRTLLMVLLVVCFCLFPVTAKAGNTNPYLYLEIYMYDTDPDDSEYGCALNAPLCPEICYHSIMPLPGEITCYSAKAPYYYAVIPIHVGHIDEPIETCTPVPCGTTGGFAGVAYGVSTSGVAVSYVGVTPCPGFTQSIGTAPGAIMFTATTECHDWYDHPGYVKYMAAVSSLGATYFDIVNNADDGYYSVINCQLELDPTTIAGRVQWGGTKAITCDCGVNCGPVEPTTWGKIKALYR